MQRRHFIAILFIFALINMLSLTSNVMGNLERKKSHKILSWKSQLGVCGIHVCVYIWCAGALFMVGVRQSVLLAIGMLKDKYELHGVWNRAQEFCAPTDSPSLIFSFLLPWDTISWPVMGTFQYAEIMRWWEVVTNDWCRGMQRIPNRDCPFRVYFAFLRCFVVPFFNKSFVF